MVVVLRLLSCVTLLACVAVFLATFVHGIHLVVDETAMLLGPAILISVFSIAPVGRRFRRRYEERWGAPPDQSRTWFNARCQLQSWGGVLIAGGIIVMLFIGGFLVLRPGSEGTPAVHDGEFVLRKKGGRIVRSITAQEYHYLRVRELRGAALWWTIFAGVPFFFYLSICPRLESDLK